VDIKHIIKDYLSQLEISEKKQKICEKIKKNNPLQIRYCCYCGNFCKAYQPFRGWHINVNGWRWMRRVFCGCGEHQNEHFRYHQAVESMLPFF